MVNKLKICILILYQYTIEQISSQIIDRASDRASGRSVELLLHKICKLSFLIVIFYIPNTLAVKDYELSESRKCVAQFSFYEKKYNLPIDSLYSISLQETRKKHSQFNLGIVWPWTVNVEGAGYYFNTKEEAVNFTKKQIQSGKRSIDVGCMQINLKYHPDAFSSLNQAFSPKNNVDYGAKLLREKYEKYGNWTKAIGSYHSESSDKGRKYSDSVKKIAKNIDVHKDQVKEISKNKKYFLASMRGERKSTESRYGYSKNSSGSYRRNNDSKIYKSSDIFRKKTDSKRKYDVTSSGRLRESVIYVND